MAAIANVTVKKSDGVTDIVYTAMNGGAASVDRPAQWTCIASNTVKAYRTSLEFKAHLNGTKMARRVEIMALHHVVRPVNGVDTRIGRIPIVFTCPIPEWATDAEINEAVDQTINLLASTHIRSHVKSGYCPT